MKELFQIEYVLKKGSINVLWNLLSTPNGMAEWFADKVQADDSIYTFQWGKHSDQAKLITSIPGECIRFHWLHDTQDTYFEIAIQKSELTGEINLIVTDHATKEDQEDAIHLWNSEIEKLIRRTGL